MTSRRTLLKAATLGAALVLAGAAGASAATGHFSRAAQPAAAARAHFVPRASVDTSTESKYTPITPCRIVDTRVKGGPIKANTTRAFAALGSGNFSAQGGQSCGIPTSATAVTGSIISVDAAGGGHADIWAEGSRDSGASFINFAPHPTISASGTIPIGAGADNFVVGVYSSATQVVIQLTGYYMPPLAAYVDASGTLVRGSRVKSITTFGDPGYYIVDFDRAVSGCYYAANSSSAGDTVEVGPSSGDSTGVSVQIESGTTPANADFYLTVTC